MIFAALEWGRILTLPAAALIGAVVIVVLDRSATEPKDDHR